ncbi:unnamed protein product [Paramecium octaurelia]|uniref:RING-type E3 ubiquitin transferase n=1 Tax=Paramecium octaurelia TaxID=43137 RepID=A0A8S1WM33_PAROT|nr:unnamed protein product [Paramecium octaurelia]
MNVIDELRKTRFPEKFQELVLKKRRAQTNLNEYETRKQRQQTYVPQANKEQICTLCQSIYVDYVTTICDHSFCQKCLLENLHKSRKQCPTCKKEFKGDFAFPCLSIDHWIGITQTSNMDYTLKLKQIALWKEQGKVKEFTVGMKLDILNIAFIWCEGEVKEIRYGKDGQPKEVLIHYFEFDTAYDEFIDVDSFRLALYGTITNQKNAIQYQQSRVEKFQSHFIFSQNRALLSRANLSLMRLASLITSLRQNRLNNQN